MGESKKRIEFIDLAKGICILLVVFHHILTGGHGAIKLHTDNLIEVNNYFGCFRQPLYFFLSGAFFKSYGSFKDFLVRKINKLLVPFFVFYICVSVPVMLKKDFTLSGLMRNLFAFVEPERFWNYPIWFLWSLFVSCIIYYFIHKIGMRTKYPIAIIILLSFLLGIIGYECCSFKINIPAFIDTSMTAMPFFAMGYLTRNYTSLFMSNRIDYLWNLSCVILLVIFVFFAGNGNPVYARNEYNMTIVQLYISGLGGGLLILILCKQLVKIPLISYLGKHSLIILLTHRPLIEIFLKPIARFHFPDEITVMLVLMIMAFSYLIIIPIMQNFFPYVVARKDLLKIH